MYIIYIIKRKKKSILYVCIHQESHKNFNLVDPRCFSKPCSNSLDHFHLPCLQWGETLWIVYDSLGWNRKDSPTARQIKHPHQILRIMPRTCFTNKCYYWWHHTQHLLSFNPLNLLKLRSLETSSAFAGGGLVFTFKHKGLSDDLVYTIMQWFNRLFVFCKITRVIRRDFCNINVNSMLTICPSGFSKEKDKGERLKIIRPKS